MDVWIKREGEPPAEKPRKSWTKPNLVELRDDSAQAVGLRDHIERRRKG